MITDFVAYLGGENVKTVSAWMGFFMTGWTGDARGLTPIKHDGI